MSWCLFLETYPKWNSRLSSRRLFLLSLWKWRTRWKWSRYCFLFLYSLLLVTAIPQNRSSVLSPRPIVVATFLWIHKTLQNTGHPGPTWSHSFGPATVLTRFVIMLIARLHGTSGLWHLWTCEGGVCCRLQLLCKPTLRLRTQQCNQWRHLAVEYGPAWKWWRSPVFH